MSELSSNEWTLVLVGAGAGFCLAALLGSLLVWAALPIFKKRQRPEQAEAPLPSPCPMSVAKARDIAEGMMAHGELRIQAIAALLGHLETLEASVNTAAGKLHRQDAALDRYRNVLKETLDDEAVDAAGA